MSIANFCAKTFCYLLAGGMKGSVLPVDIFGKIEALLPAFPNPANIKKLTSLFINLIISVQRRLWKAETGFKPVSLLKKQK